MSKRTKTSPFITSSNINMALGIAQVSAGLYKGLAIELLVSWTLTALGFTALVALNTNSTYLEIITCTTLFTFLMCRLLSPGTRLKLLKMSPSLNSLRQLTPALDGVHLCYSRCAAHGYMSYSSRGRCCSS